MQGVNDILATSSQPGTACDSAFADSFPLVNRSSVWRSFALHSRRRRGGGGVPIFIDLSENRQTDDDGRNSIACSRAPPVCLMSSQRSRNKTRLLKRSWKCSSLNIFASLQCCSKRGHKICHVIFLTHIFFASSHPPWQPLPISSKASNVRPGFAQTWYALKELENKMQCLIPWKACCTLVAGRLQSAFGERLRRRRRWRRRRWRRPRHPRWQGRRRRRPRWPPRNRAGCEDHIHELVIGLNLKVRKRY